MGVVLPGFSFLCLRLRQRSQAAKREKQAGGPWLPVNWTGNGWGVGALWLVLLWQLWLSRWRLNHWIGEESKDDPNNGKGCVSEELLHWRIGSS